MIKQFTNLEKKPAVVGDEFEESVDFEVVAVVDGVDPEVVGAAVDPVLH